MTLESQMDHNAVVLEAFNALGGSASQALVYHLETKYRISVKAGGPAISIQDLEGALVQMLGDAGTMLMDKVRSKLDSVIFDG